MKPFWSKISEKKELKRVAQDRIRDEKLNSIILNPQAVDGDMKYTSTPYDVNYLNGNQAAGELTESFSERSGKMLMLQLVEHTELSSRKFVLNPGNGIRIGSSPENNDIVLANSSLAELQCEIFCVQNKIYVRHCGREVRTLLRRKADQAIVDERGIRLMSGDRIILGNIYYEVTLIETT